MYFIVNTTKQTVIISDIKITLGPRQGIDLDRFVTRENTNRSQCLKSLFSKGILQIKSKDEKNIEEKIEKEEIPKNTESLDIEQMKQDIIKGVKESLIGNLPSQPQNNGISKDELISILSSFVGKNNIDVSNKNKEENSINDDVLSDIHKRTIDRVSKKVEKSEINYQKVNSEDKTIDNSISELESMLGD